MLKNKIKIITAILFASMAIKPAVAQENKKLAPEFKGITFTPASYALEHSDKITYHLLCHSGALNFGLNKDFKVSPSFAISGGLAEVWFPNEKPVLTNRLTANLGAGTGLGSVYIFADAGLGVMNGMMFHQFNLGGSLKICDINDKTALSCFAVGYYEKFNKMPFALGVIAGISLNFSK